MFVSAYIKDRNRAFLAWQRTTLARMLKYQNPALFMEMRLGKSFLSVEYCIRKVLRRVLVFCPKTAAVSWADELREEKLPCNILETAKQKHAAVLSTAPGWYLASYNTVLNVNLNLAEWDAIILDESHTIKSPRAATTNKLLKYYHRIPHKILLTGTPDPEEIIETVTQLLFKDGSVLGCRTYWEFRARHMRCVGYDWVLKPGVYEQLRALLHKSCIYLSQKMAGWDTTTIKEKVFFKLNEKQKVYIRELLEDFETTINNKSYITKYILPRTIWMSRIAGGYIDNCILNPAKELWLLDYVKQHPGRPVILWFRFNDVLVRFYKLLKIRGYRVAALYENCTIAERQRVQREFQAGKLDYVLLQVALGRYSLNLSRAYEAIYVSNSYSGEMRTQSEMRIAHHARQSPPRYKDLLFENSIEVEILEMLRDKHFSFRFVWERLIKLKDML